MTTTAAESIHIIEPSRPERRPSALPDHDPEEYVALLLPPAHPEVGPLLVESHSAPFEHADREGAGAYSSAPQVPEARAIPTQVIQEAAEEPGPRQLTREEGQRLFDERARRFLGMSGREFKRRYEAGELDPNDDNVLRLALLLPFGR
jgi:hypothetical protein